jgi:hypothetical protein
MQDEQRIHEPHAIMKSKWQLQTLAVISFLIISPGMAHAQNGPTPQPPSAPRSTIPPPTPVYAPRFEQRYGVPGSPGQPFPAIDPTTGLPIPKPLPEWKDPDWKDPDTVLSNVVYNGLPVTEVARNLEDQFKSEFDILLPQDFGDLQTAHAGDEIVDWNSATVHLRLKNVSASEVFNAMNLLFENNRTPLRWELKMNGNRRVALLRVLQDPSPADPFRKPELKRVYYVGDLIGDEKSYGMSMKEIIKTIQDVWQMAYGQAGLIQFHDKAQLLIVTGTDDQINLIQQTLEALHTKAATARARREETGLESKTDEPKTTGGGGSK